MQQQFARIQDVSTEKKRVAFSRKSAENCLERSHPKQSARKNNRKRLDAARVLCDVANLSDRAMEALEPLGVLPTDPEQRREVLLQGEIVGRSVANQLNFLLTKGEFITGISFARVDTTTGKLRFRIPGTADTLFEKAVTNPTIDWRRFAKCDACSRFFYKPRKGSQTCTRKCANVISQRERYARVKLAHELSKQGMSLKKIAHELGVDLGQAQRYLRVKR